MAGCQRRGNKSRYLGGTNMDATTIARHAIGNLLDGHSPNGDKPADMGRFAECYTEMVRAYSGGGTEAARKIYAVYAGSDAEIAALRAADPQPKRQQRTRYTLSELRSTVFEPARTIVPGLLPEGQTLLVARPKIGKSWMALQAGIAVGSGGIFLGQQVQRTPVFYLALEDRPLRMLDRTGKQMAPTDTDITFEHKWPSLANEGAGLLMAEVDKGGYGLVIVDTLQRAFTGLDMVRDGAKITARMAELQEYCLDRHIAMLVVHHSRKGSGGDAIDDVLGATGIAGNADASWLISRQRGQRDATFYVTGRDIEERSLSLDFDRELFCWQLLGDAGDVRANTVQANIIDAIIELGGTATTTKIARFLGLAAPNVSRELGELVVKGAVLKNPSVGSEVPYSLPKSTDDNS